MEATPPTPAPSAREIQRALRLVENQKRASRIYYQRHREEIQQKSLAYWEAHKEVINERRRARYALKSKRPPQALQTIAP